MEFGKGIYKVWVERVLYRHGTLSKAKAFAKDMSRQYGRRFYVECGDDDDAPIRLAAFEHGRAITP